MQNIRPLAIAIDKSKADLWLSKQSEQTKQVSKILEDKTIIQQAIIDKNAYVDPTAQLIGGMIVSKGCYIGPFAVIRLDEKPNPQPLIIGENTNLQDCCVVHSTTQHIGSGVIVAHQAIVHGAFVEDDVTIYIQAVADGGGTVLGKGCFLHQGSYVGKGIKIPSNALVEPGQKVLTQADADALNPVPDALRDIQTHVLELNAAHNKLHRNWSIYTQKI